MLRLLTTAIAARRESRAGSARKARGFLASSALCAALIAGLTIGGTAPAAITTLYADVGPGYTITLTDAAGAAVTQLAPGDYTIVVNDQSVEHNFHLTGPGAVDLATTVAFVGQETWTVTLVAGSYHFACDPHADGMFGDFSVSDVDTTPPETAIDSGPSGSVNSAEASFVFSASEPGASFECALDGALFALCSSPQVFSNLAEGAHTFEVRATDAVGNLDTTPASASWTVDVVAPETAIDQGPEGTVGSSSVSFAFSASEPAGFECALDGAAFAACASPQGYAGLAEGAHTFEVRAVDAAGNLDASPARRAFAVNTNALYATSGPGYTITLTDAAGTPVTSLEAGTYTIVVHDQAAVHNFHLSGADVERATTVAFVGEEIWTVTLSPGQYRFQCDPHPGMEGSFEVVDTTPPETWIDSGPSGSVSSAEAGFVFSASEPGSTFECALDGAVFALCTSPQAFGNLGDGPHTFEVRATDAIGNLDTTPASASWTIDTVAPDTAIDQGPEGTVGSSSVSFAFSASEPAGFECALDGGLFTVCTSPATYSGLADGAHSFEVRATDAAGNADPSPAARAFTIDTTALYGTVGPGYTISFTDAAGAPVTNLPAGTYTIVVHDNAAIHNFHLTGPDVERSTMLEFVGEEIWTVTLGGGQYRFQCDPHPGMDGTFTVGADTTPPETTIDSGPNGLTAGSAAAFSFSSTEADSSFECALDGAAFAACSSPVSFVGLADGPHTFQVRAADAAGNADATPADRTWTVDTAAPETSIESGPEASAATSSATLTFSADDAGATFECALDGAPFAACSSPTVYEGLADGAHTFEVRATDAAGNTDATPAARSWTVDTAMPTTTITAASFEFSSDDPGTSFECALDGAAFSACSSPQSYTGLASGSHSFVVRAVDAGGNPGTTVSDVTWRVEAPQQQPLGGHR